MLKKPRQASDGDIPDVRADEPERAMEQFTAGVRRVLAAPKPRGRCATSLEARQGRHRALGTQRWLPRGSTEGRQCDALQHGVRSAISFHRVSRNVGSKHSSRNPSIIRRSLRQ